MVVGPRGQKLHELGTPCPEYPGKFPEYPGCYNPTPLKKSRPEIYGESAKLKGSVRVSYLDEFVTTPDIWN